MSKENWIVLAGSVPLFGFILLCWYYDWCGFDHSKCGWHPEDDAHARQLIKEGKG